MIIIYIISKFDEIIIKATSYFLKETLPWGKFCGDFEKDRH